MLSRLMEKANGKMGKKIIEKETEIKETIEEIHIFGRGNESLETKTESKRN